MCKRYDSFTKKIIGKTMIRNKSKKSKESKIEYPEFCFECGEKLDKGYCEKCKRKYASSK